MGSIFQNQSVLEKKPVSYRRRQYLKSRKTDRPRLTKHEQNEQLAFCDWLKANFPDVHFRSDTGSGAFNSKFEKNIHSRQQSSDSEPDIMIFAARRGYHGLLIELKRTGFELRMKRDGRTIRVYKDSRGKIIGRDYKIRLKGDWASLHIEKQAKCLEDYNRIGYFARFAVGLENAKKLVCWYFDEPYVENASLF